MSHCPHCGDLIDAPKKGKPRSVPQHRRFFALCRAAYFHWPEAHAFRPESEEHLRRYLQAKAGYHTVTTIDIASSTPEQAVLAVSAAMKNAGPYAFVKPSETKLHVFAPKSIKFYELPHLAACALFDAVAEIIEAETGIRCDDMIKTTPRKSAKKQAMEVAL